ncbi:hypothetical protein PRZ48_013650 [Zasmidium cellare]|uniref:Mating-type protein MAT-1 n=1 Tax=Zasmidium cellare TaxID=395010 RepID=A0ABR0E1N0_ZASCE|nr:hypothetical protein PRZ48_013650 [Zasmidium cellare]
MATDTLTDEFRTFLEGCTPEMASQIISALQQAGRHTEPSAASGMTGSAVAKTSKRQRKKQKAELALALHGPVGPLRPLNSWMAFRNFYNRMLSPRTQKAISKLLRILWKADPFKAKWAIIAKTYSTLRGHLEKKDAPLDAFFIICAPLVGVIPPEEYLQTMGWQLGSPQDGDDENMPQITRLFTPDLDSFPEEFTTTTLSVDDLVNHCYAQGYANSSSNGSPSVSTQGSLTMVSKPTAITTNDEGEATQMASSAQTNTDSVSAAATSNNSTDEELRQALLSEIAKSPSSQAFSAPAPAPAGQASLEQAASGLQQLGAENPYVAAFDPASMFDVNFNPVDPNTTVEDNGDWDAFELGFLGPGAFPRVEHEQDSALSDGMSIDWDAFVNQ